MKNQRIKRLPSLLLRDPTGTARLPRGRRRQIIYLNDQIADLKELMRWITAAMVVTDTPTAAAAEAYEGLRASVVQASRDRNRLLVTLASLTYAIAEGQSIETIGSKIDEEASRNGLVRTSDASNPDYFDFENDRPACWSIEVTKPAYIDRESGALIRPGIAKWIEVEPPAPSIEIELIAVTGTSDAEIGYESNDASEVSLGLATDLTSDSGTAGEDTEPVLGAESDAKGLES